MIKLKEDGTELKAVVFDLGNVLLDFNPRRFMFELGIDPNYYDRLHKVFTGASEWGDLDRGIISDEEFLASALKKEPLLKKEITLYHKHWYDHFHAIPENVADFYQIREAGAKTYVLSNFQKTCFAEILPHNIFLDDFDGKVLSCECHLCKPEPEIYKYLIETYGLDPAHSVFIDDVAANAQGARDAGMKAIHLPSNGPILPYFTIEE